MSVWPTSEAIDWPSTGHVLIICLASFKLSNRLVGYKIVFSKQLWTIKCYFSIVFCCSFMNNSISFLRIVIHNWLILSFVLPMGNMILCLQVQNLWMLPVYTTHSHQRQCLHLDPSWNSTSTPKIRVPTSHWCQVSIYGPQWHIPPTGNMQHLSWHHPCPLPC